MRHCETMDRNKGAGPPDPEINSKEAHADQSLADVKLIHSLAGQNRLATSRTAAEDSLAAMNGGLTASTSKAGKRNGGGERPSKRPRLVWTTELHQRFLNAVNHLGVKSAVPKTILQVMNVEGMTRENVASHLQKYRLYLKRVKGLPSTAPLPHDHRLTAPYEAAPHAGGYVPRPPAGMHMYAHIPTAAGYPPPLQPSSTHGHQAMGAAIPMLSSDQLVLGLGTYSSLAARLQGGPQPGVATHSQLPIHSANQIAALYPHAAVNHGSQLHSPYNLACYAQAAAGVLPSPLTAASLASYARQGEAPGDNTVSPAAAAAVAAIAAAGGYGRATAGLLPASSQALQLPAHANLMQHLGAGTGAMGTGPDGHCWPAGWRMQGGSTRPPGWP